jgi:hypothetical protein
MFLASEDSSYMSGEIMIVDCGYSLNHDLSFNNKIELPDDNKR